MSRHRDGDHFPIYKFGTAFSFLILGVAIWYSNGARSVFPALSVGVLLSTVVILTAAVVDRRSWSSSITWSLLPVAVIGVVYRAYVFLFPASLVGVDPTNYAVEIGRVIRTGTTATISYNFYSEAPFSISYPALVGIGTGAPPSDSMLIYPIMLGVVSPTVAAAVAIRIAPEQDSLVALVAGVLGAVATMSVHFGYIPIAQSLAMVYWTLLVLYLCRYYQLVCRRTLLLITLGLLALLFTHKLPLLVAFLVLTAYVGLTLLQSLRSAPPRGSTQRQYLGLLLLGIVGVLAIVQWAYITQFVSSVIVQSIGVLLTDSIEISAPLVAEQPTAAVGPDGGLSGIIVRRGHGLSLVMIGGVSWMYQAFKRPANPAVRFLLAGATVPIVLLGVFAIGNSPTGESIPSPRIIAYMEPVVIPLFVTAVGGVLTMVRRHSGEAVYEDRRQYREVAVFVVVLVVLGGLFTAQVVSPRAAPDYPESPRDYLSGPEVDAKEFGNQHLGQTVYTDWFTTVSGKRNPEVDAGARPEWEPIGAPLLNANVTGQGYGYVLFRTDVEYYLTAEGPWSLLWDPTGPLDREYNRVYESGGATLYAERNQDAG